MYAEEGGVYVHPFTADVKSGKLGHFCCIFEDHRQTASQRGLRDPRQECLS